MEDLLKQIRSCSICQQHLPNAPNPIVQINEYSKIIIIGQAPSRRVHETRIPWNDASGRKLREWLAVDESDFYNPNLFSILPMGFCYPGKGKSGDLPPRPECAKLWHPQLSQAFHSDPLLILVGQYAQRYYLKSTFKGNLTDTVKNYSAYLPKYFPLPHPSPRNQNWVKTNPWFSNEVLPDLKEIVHNLLQKNS